MATYYVNTLADAGGDGTTNATTGEHCAWDTIADVNAASFSAGDSILFNKGCTWREKLTVPSSGSIGSVITFGAYGTGDDPIINGADIVATFVDQTGNVWDATVTTEPKNIWLDGAVGTKAASKGALDAAHEWFWAADVLSVYHVGDPSASHTVEASIRTAAIYCDNQDYITIDGLHMQYGNVDALVALKDSKYCIVQNCTMHDTHDHAIMAWLNDSGGHNFNHNEIYNTGRNRDVPGEGSGIQLLDTVTIDCTIEYNEIYNILGDSHDHGIYDESTSSTIIRYNYIHDSVGTGIKESLTDIAPEIYYNIFVNCAPAAIMVQPTGAAKIYNNTIYNCGVYPGTSPYGGVWYLGNYGGSGAFKNNIIYGAGNGIIVDTSSAGYSGDYNLVYGEINYGQWVGENQSTLALWKTASSQDAHSLNVDPLFVSTVTPDFHLQSTSPCINAGVDVGLTEDYEGNPIW